MSQDPTGSLGGYDRPGQLLSYREVGATASEHLPGGYRHLRAVRQIGFGQGWFDTAALRLTNWDMHRRAGVRVDTNSSVSLDQIVALSIGIGPFRVNAPVRVVSVVANDRERGFAYGTLPSHPEIGEERFTVRIDDDDIVRAEIRAFSRPGRWFTRVADPLSRRVQDAITHRYLKALEST